MLKALTQPLNAPAYHETISALSVEDEERTKAATMRGELWLSRENSRQRKTMDSHAWDMGDERGSRKTVRYGFPPCGGLDTTLQKKSCLTCFSFKGELLEGNRQVMPLCPGENFPLAFKS